MTGEGGSCLRVIACGLILIACGCAGLVPGTPPGSDAPDPMPAAAVHAGGPGPGSYEEALRAWNTPEDIAAWIGPRFAYDIDRAIALSENERRKGAAPPILAPAEMFARPTGTCLDLARFGLETLQRIDPSARPKYLMVEFEPLQIRGHTLRRHWLVSFRRGGTVYVFSDSKRPWLVDGPYETIGAFIASYERYRGRTIVGFREADSYLRRSRTPRTGPLSGMFRPAASSIPFLPAFPTPRAGLGLLERRSGIRSNAPLSAGELR
jgi:hypothetical protein